MNNWLINVPEHVGGGVLGEQVEQEPVADVATAEEVVGEAHVLRGEVTEPKSVIRQKVKPGLINGKQFFFPSSSFSPSIN